MMIGSMRRMRLVAWPRVRFKRGQGLYEIRHGDWNGLVLGICTMNCLHLSSSEKSQLLSISPPCPPRPPPLRQLLKETAAIRPAVSTQSSSNSLTAPQAQSANIFASITAFEDMRPAYQATSIQAPRTRRRTHTHTKQSTSPPTNLTSPPPPPPSPPAPQSSPAAHPSQPSCTPPLRGC